MELVEELDVSNVAIKENQKVKSNTDSTGMTDQKNLALNDMVAIAYEVSKNYVFMQRKHKKWFCLNWWIILNLNLALVQNWNWKIAAPWS